MRRLLFLVGFFGILNGYSQEGLDSRSSLDQFIKTAVNHHYKSFFTLEDSVISVGDVMICDIYFSFDSPEILPISFGLLDSIAEFIIKNDTSVFEITHHTDSRGNDNYCLRLSEVRARAIFDYLINRGVEEKQMTYKGMGENDIIISDKDINSQESDESREVLHAVNRRTVLEVKSLIE